MTDVVGPVSAARATGGWRASLHVAAPALISVLTLLALTAVISWGVGHPERFLSPAVYDATLSAATLARLGPIFFSGLLVCPAMRLRGATMKWSLAGTFVTPAVFALLSGVGQLRYFPPAEAAYYIVNPMFVAAFGAQCAWAAAGEMFVRWRRAGWGDVSGRPLVVALMIAICGLALLYTGVIWDGGKHMFYLWMSGYTALFGTGQ